MNKTLTNVLRPPFQQQQQLVAHVDGAEVDGARDRLLLALQDANLERMHKQLWYAGRRGNISPLHHQIVIRREIVLTERARLHLVWSERTIYVQRLRDELLDWEYFSSIACKDPAIYQAATGFLLSYAHLIRYPSDLEIAKAIGLVSEHVTWKGRWQTFRSSILHDLAEREVHDRFEYGELRLGRLNQIYRLKGLGLVYFTAYREYSSYFGDNCKTLVALFALVSVALSAMQVMTAFDGIPQNVKVTLYRCSIATLVALAGSCAFLLALYLGLYLWNWILIFVRRRSRQKVRSGIRAA